MGIIISLNNTPTNCGYVTAGGSPGMLRLRTDDGTTQAVELRPAGALAAAIQLSATTVAVGPSDTTVEVRLAGASITLGDGVIEVVSAGSVIVSYTFTSITRAEIQFEGRFQCRLSTDPDGFNHPWGVASSFGLYAVQGPNPAAPYEPPLGRIVRFQDPVALRPLCPAIGVYVRRVRGQLAGGSVVAFDSGDAIIGQPVRLGPSCKFDAQDGAIAPPGFEPISDFQIHIGTAFSGATEPGIYRPAPSGPPPSKAPYADGFFRMDQVGTLTPADFGYPEPNWTARANAVTAQKLVDLTASVATTPRDTAIRNRRIQEHTNNLSGLRFTMRMMERYTGIVDRELAITPGDSTVLRSFEASTAFRFYGEFFDFDSDCQSGTVWGTIGPV